VSAIKDGGSILPVMRSNCGGYGIAPHSDGLTIRDWFAGMALQGEIASPTSGIFEADSITFQEVAWDCYRFADAMLAARERKEDA